VTFEVPAALLLGLLGSLHCLGMCGPLALALPVRPGTGRGGLVAGRLAYNLGRAVTYSLLGAVVGLLGHGLRLAGLQRALSLGAGAVILWHVAGRLGWRTRIAAALGRVARAGRRPTAPVSAWSRRLQAAMAPRLRVAGGSPWVFGLLNGLLPCGLVGIALVGAAATGSALAGAAFMGLFGLGTLPLMFAASLVGGAATARFGGRLQRWAPVALGLLALLFLARGVAVPGARAEGVPPPCHGAEVSNPGP
jgi:sulfite exporter TauE/SafE